VAIADFDHDTHLDLVTSTTTVLLGNGDGTFGSGTTNLVSGTSLDVVVADFNGDGNPDFAVPDTTTAQVRVIFGDGAGGFPTNTSLATTSASCLAAADFDNDGHVDIVTANDYSSGSLAFLPGNGSGGFGPATNYTSFFLGRPQSIATGDLDSDGNRDLVVAGTMTLGQVVALRGMGDGTFRSITNFSYTDTARSAVFANINGDDIPDIVVVARNVFLHAGLGRGKFAPATTFSTQFSSGTGRRVAAADLNGDARPDLVVGSFGGTLVNVFLNESRPLLTVAPIGDCVRLTWPNWAFDLQSRSSLQDENEWATTADVPVVAGASKVVTNRVDQKHNFYRLHLH
jgi:hypothetical protein